MTTDHTAVLPYLLLQDFPTTHFTFEAWISSSDFCHAGEQGVGPSSTAESTGGSLSQTSSSSSSRGECNPTAAHQSSATVTWTWTPPNKRSLLQRNAASRGGHRAASRAASWVQLQVTCLISCRPTSSHHRSCFGPPPSSLHSPHVQ